MLPQELRQYTNRKVFIALVCMIGATLIATVATAFTITALLVIRQHAQVHNDTRVEVEMLLTNLNEAETSQRGFLLTGDPEYLGPYNDATHKIPAQITFIRANTVGDAAKADVAKLSPLVDKKLAEEAATVSLRQAGDAQGAMNLVQGGSGKELMSQIQVIAGRIQAAKATQVVQDRVSITNLAVLARNISVVTTFVILGLAITVYWFYLKAIQRERALDRAKDEFVSLASHQLRTPATGIKSILSMIVAGDFGSLNERQAYFMKRALESNERELNIIEELLNVAKADAGRLVLHATSFSLGDLVKTIAEEQHGAIDKKKQNLVINQPQKPVHVRADEEKLYMAIGNLLDNARKYTPEEGKISIGISNRHNHAHVEIADSGIGIEAGEVEHIFDRFQRASDAVRGNVEGAGLGLYLARRIAELHGGTIDVSSKLGKGTKFVMIIPEGDYNAAEGAGS